MSQYNLRGFMKRLPGCGGIVYDLDNTLVRGLASCRYDNNSPGRLLDSIISVMGKDIAVPENL